MEILQVLLSLFLNGENGGAFAPVIKRLANNSFDLKKTLLSLTPEEVEPIIKEFMKFSDKKSPTNGYSPSVGLDPIAMIADKEIVYTLNKYFHEP
ncbi:MAG: hypothetical protein E7346_01420 [Clostridiales bacterium]|nr:hypothetical protein [Clostridiales bacterium]MBQ3046654.1 hypothetical protein [Clostridia bacterium]